MIFSILKFFARTTSCMIVLLLASLTVHAQTGLLIDPTTLTNTGLTGDDSSTTRTLPTTGTFQFYGVTRTTVSVITNGNLNFSSNTTFTNGSFPTSVARIAPFWDDLITTNTAPASVILDNQPRARIIAQIRVAVAVYAALRITLQTSR